MRKKEVSEFLNEVEPPFRIVTKKGTVMTCRGVIELNDNTLTFRDMYNMTSKQELEDISTLQDMDTSKGVGYK